RSLGSTGAAANRTDRQRSASISCRRRLVSQILPICRDRTSAMDVSAANSDSGQDKRGVSDRSALARLALLLGNFVIGIAVLAPSGMLDQLAHGLGVSIGDAGLLITYGAVVLCFGSPLMAWATTRIDRRTLLAGTLLIVALGNAASALASGYVSLLVA